MPDLSPTQIDPELTSRLGQIVIRSASVESWITALLATITQGDPGAMMLMTSNVAAGTQSRWIRGLLAKHPHEAVSNARILSLLNRADALRGKRNELVHGLWDSTGCAPLTVNVQSISLERTQPEVTRLVTIQELDELVVQINEWIADYIEHGRDLGFPRRPGETQSIFSD
jgi:hypothetical protein